MTTRKSPTNASRKLMALGIMLIASVAFAADSAQPGRPGPTKEMREKMASVHEQMATCLRSDRPVGECHKEMMKKCQDLMAKEGCPMMGMHDHVMKQHSSQGPDTK